MTSQEILEKYLDFYKKRDHKQVSNVSLVPEGDSTLLFVNSGMFPLVPYLSGMEHPLGKRLVNVQRSLRFEDIDEIGDPSHTTAFHMIGNWSLGDYFKKDQLPWAYEFLIEVLKLDPKKLFATVFAGDESAPKDVESIKIIQEVFKKYGIDAKEGEKIFTYGKKSNWWQRGEAVGELGGPDSEVYYYMREGLPPVGTGPEDDEAGFFEIGNSVFMQYIKGENGWTPLPQSNVDFGGGLERIAVAVQGKSDIYETDNFWFLIQKIQEITGKDYYADEQTKRNMRVLADHMRASTFLAMDGVTPSNKEQGYILRRLIRRMVRAGRSLGVDKDLSVRLVSAVCEKFSWLYPDLTKKVKEIESVFQEEENKFFKVLAKAMTEVEKFIIEYGEANKTQEKLLHPTDIAKEAFNLYQSNGLPTEIFYQELLDRNVKFSQSEVDAEHTKLVSLHQVASRAGMEKKFKGGLADASEVSMKYHTATHLLQQALRELVGEHIRQLGSNITGERLRFDFPNPTKLTEAQIKEVEDTVNRHINEKIPVNFEILPKVEALKTGALHLPNETYPDMVKVYYVGVSIPTAVSKEFCGGPHVTNTGDIGRIEIYKQEALGNGKLRIYARLAQ